MVQAGYPLKSSLLFLFALNIGAHDRISWRRLAGRYVMDQKK